MGTESSKTGKIQSHLGQCGPWQSWDRNARLLERFFFFFSQREDRV